jgi:hypothetical protein
MFNIGNNAANITLNFASLGVKGKPMVRDLWKKADLGIFKNQFSKKINAHGVLLLKISAKAS